MMSFVPNLDYCEGCKHYIGWDKVKQKLVCTQNQPNIGLYVFCHLKNKGPEQLPQLKLDGEPYV